MSGAGDGAEPRERATPAVTQLVTPRPEGSGAAADTPTPAPIDARSDVPPRGTPAALPARVHDAVAPAEAPGRPRSDDDAYTLPPAALPVVERIRARLGAPLVVASADAGPRLAVRVEVPEVWDVVRLDAAAVAPVAAVKRAALATLMSGTATVEDYVVKLNGATVLDEGASLAAVGARDGSIFLVTHRRRRPVR